MNETMIGELDELMVKVEINQSGERSISDSQAIRSFFLRWRRHGAFVSIEEWAKYLEHRGWDESAIEKVIELAAVDRANWV